MANLTAISFLCLLVLVGGYLYSGGSLLPSTKGAETPEATQIWIIWGAAAALPLITTVLWLIRLATRTGD